MQHFEGIIFVLTILMGLSAVADKVRVPLPVLLVIAGVAIGFAPGFPVLILDPEVVFLLFLPPLLYDAASHTYWHDFWAEIRPISTLAITLVLFTTVAVALTTYYFIPGFSWPLAFILGAIVSPPDAAAATSITKGLKLNKRVITILEGESLINDASALIAYRFGLIALTTGSFIFWKASLDFLLLVCGGILLGIVVGYFFVLIHKKIKHNSIVSTSLTLLTPFICYLIAEQLHTSGVLAVVATGLFMSWRSPEVFSYQTRMRSRSVWDTLVFILSGFVFFLIGQQLPAVLRNLGKYSLTLLLFYGFIISLIVILVRIIWVFVAAYSQHIIGSKNRSFGLKEISDERANTWKNVLIVAWTGTRGIVSLATALALPLTRAGDQPFPQRSLILFLTFVVIFVTLIVQGLSIPLLIRILNVKPTAKSYQEERELQLFMAQATTDFIENGFPIDIEDSVKDQLKMQYEHIIRHLLREMENDSKRAENDESPHLLIPLPPLLAAQIKISKFQRELLLKIHKEGTYSHQIVRKAEQELDQDDLRLNKLLKKGDE